MMAMLPPPTVNELAPSQRTRLVRSTRKLQAMLGTTPQVVEPPQPVRRNPRKLALTLAPHPTHPNRPLVLTFSAPSPDLIYTHTRSRSNSAADRDRPPLSPMTPMDSTSRRKRMAKLTRTLGENIPPELVSNPHPRRKDMPDFEALAESEYGSSEETLIDAAAPFMDMKPMPPPPPSPMRSSSASVRSGRRIQHKRSATGWGHRKEQGWSGEWNGSDRDDILKRLRNLK